MPLLFLGLLFLVIGFIFKFLPPKKINIIYGWRTFFAAKNQDTWDEAQKYGANLMIIFGIASVLLGCLIYILVRDLHIILGFIGFILSISALILLGELHLRKVFNSDGNRKTLNS